MKLLALFVLAAAAGTAQQELEVVRTKTLRPNQAGVLRISDSELCFEPKGKQEAHCWAYQDIQSLDRVGPAELELLSYEDVAWKLGRDRSYRFELRGGELSDALFDRLAEAVGKPVTDRVVAEPSGSYQTIPAKHLKTLGGSEGELLLAPDRIVYLSDADEQSREWRLDREVESVWSADPYRLEVHVYEGRAGSFRQPKVYRFALKKPLDPELYRRLKLRLFEIDREHGLVR